MDLAQHTGSLTAEEIAGILTQIDLLYQQASLLKPVDSCFPFARVLSQLCRHEQIEAMVYAGASPRVIHGIRNLRARTYASCLQRMSDVCQVRMRSASEAASQAGEWIVFARVNWRRVKLLWYLLRLRSARRAYLAGYRVNVASVVQKLELLWHAP
jgi:hypothetical protein